MTIIYMLCHHVISGRERKFSGGSLRSQYAQRSSNSGAKRVLTHPADVEAVASALVSVFWIIKIQDLYSLLLKIEFKITILCF